MMLDLIMQAAAVADSDGVFGVYLAETEDEGICVEFQLGHEHDEQDRRLKQDTYCIVVDGGTVYGCAVSWGFKDRVLALRFNKKGRKGFKVDGVRLDIRGGDAREIEDGLARVLAGVPRNDGLAGAPAAA